MTREEVNENLQEDIDLEEKIKNRKKIVLNIIKIIILIIVLFILFFFINKYINTGIIEVSEHRIINEKIPDNFNGIKIIQVSDIKYGSNINNDDIKKLVKIINERKPDIVLYTGNLIDDEYNLALREDYERLFAVIDATEVLYYPDDMVSNIVFEETQAYLAGEKTAEEAERIIQSRVSLYLSERQ